MMVNRRRVSEVLTEVRPHRFKHFRQHWGRGVIVEINPPHTSIVVRRARLLWITKSDNPAKEKCSNCSRIPGGAYVQPFPTLLFYPCGSSWSSGTPGNGRFA